MTQAVRAALQAVAFGAFKSIVVGVKAMAWATGRLAPNGVPYDDRESRVMIVVFAVATSPRLALLGLDATEFLDLLRRGQCARPLSLIGAEG